MGNYVRWTGLWTLHGSIQEDSDFGACLNTRRSVSGAVLVLVKGAISWHSRMQEVAASGTSEAEYVALSEVEKEVIFLIHVQEFMEPSMRVGAVNVFEDNEGGIKLATNKHASRWTKHIDGKHHLVRDASDARKVGEDGRSARGLAHQAARHAKVLQAREVYPICSVICFKVLRVYG